MWECIIAPIYWHFGMGLLFYPHDLFGFFVSLSHVFVFGGLQKLGNLFVDSLICHLNTCYLFG